MRIWKLLFVWRSLFCRRCNFIRWLSAANFHVVQALVAINSISALWRINLRLAPNVTFEQAIVE